MIFTCLLDSKAAFGDRAGQRRTARRVRGPYSTGKCWYRPLGWYDFSFVARIQGCDRGSPVTLTGVSLINSLGTSCIVYIVTGKCLNVSFPFCAGLAEKELQGVV